MLCPVCQGSSCSDSCFPSSAMVRTAEGTPLHIGALKEGDEIVVATASGALTVDTVSLLSIAQPEVKANFITLTTNAKRDLTLTAEHHVSVGEVCCLTLKQAKDIEVGGTVWALVNNTMVKEQVVARMLSTKIGLHSPVMTNGGFPIIDSFVTSYGCHASYACHHLMRLLPYILIACKATNTCGLLHHLINVAKQSGM